MLTLCADESLLDMFSLVYHFSSLCLGDGRYRLKYCLRGLLNTNNQQPTMGHYLKKNDSTFVPDATYQVS